MKWANLKENKCPQCDGDFTKGMGVIRLEKENDKLLTHPCGFKIRERKFNDITMSIVTANLQKKWDQEGQASEGGEL